MKINSKVIAGLMTGAMLLSSVGPVYAYGDVNYGTASNEIEHFIEVGRRLESQTKYVYGGGHSNWDVQKEYNLPLEVDSSSFVSWVLYKGMGIDMGKAPIASHFKNYFEEVATGDLSNAQRGDLIVSENLVEVYLGEDEEGINLSLAATDKGNGITIIESNWGRSLEGVSILRPSIEDAKEGKNGLKYVEEAIFNEKDLLGMGGDEITMEGGSGGRDVTDKDREKIDKIVGKGEKEEDENKVEDDESGEGEGKELSNKESLFMWLDPMVDFKGTSNTHSKSETGESISSGQNKGLKGNKGGIFSGLFGN